MNLYEKWSGASLTSKEFWGIWHDFAGRYSRILKRDNPKDFICTGKGPSGRPNTYLPHWDDPESGCYGCASRCREENMSSLDWVKSGGTPMHPSGGPHMTNEELRAYFIRYYEKKEAEQRADRS